MGSVSGALQAPGSKSCPESVAGVSKGVPDTLGTLSGHLLDTLEPGAGRAPRHSPEHSDAPSFEDTLSETPWDASGPKGPEPPVWGWGCLSKLWIFSRSTRLKDVRCVFQARKFSNQENPQISEKSQRGKTQRVKLLKTSRKKKMFAEDISEFSEDSRYHFYWILEYFWISKHIFQIFAEDCFLLRGFRKFLPSGFLPLCRFQDLTSWLHGRHVISCYFWIVSSLILGRPPKSLSSYSFYPKNLFKASVRNNFSRLRITLRK